MSAHSAILRMSLPASYKYLSVLSAVIAEVLNQEQNVAEREQLVYGVQLAAQESCANIISHAYGGDENQRIEVMVAIEAAPRCIVVEIVDQGEPFDMTGTPDADLDTAHIHGYGIHIIKELMDSVHYERRAGMNCLQLVKNF